MKYVFFIVTIGFDRYKQLKIVSVDMMSVAALWG